MQKTIAELNAANAALFVTNTTGDITPAAEKAYNENLNDSVKPLERVVSASQTAILGESYIVVATATFTDPTPTEGKGFTVFVRNGTVTVGGIAYNQPGTTINRVYHSGSWKNYPIGLSGEWTPTFTGWDDTGSVTTAFFNVVGQTVNFTIWLNGTPSAAGALTISVPAVAPMDTVLAILACTGAWSARYNSVHGDLDIYIDASGSGEIRVNLETIPTPGAVELMISGQYKLA